MFEQLPEAIQKQVINYLEEDNFIQAKEIYDAWLNNQSDQPPFFSCC